MIEDSPIHGDYGHVCWPGCAAMTQGADKAMSDFDAAKAEAYEAGQVRMRERSVARIKAMHLCGDHTFEDCPGAAVRVLRAVVDALSDFQPEPYEGEAMSADPKPKRKLPKRKLRVWYEIQGPGDMNGIRLESIEEAKAFVLDYGKEDVTYTLALVCEKVVDWI